MNFLHRDSVCERLRLETRQSYRLVGSSRLGLIASDEVVRLLNRSRRGDMPACTFIPTDILKIDELAEELGIDQKKIRAWTRRTKNVPPHFRLNGHTIRFPLGHFTAWLAQNSKVTRRS